MLEVWSVKLLCAVIAFVVITICTALPTALSGWFYNRGDNGLKVLQMARCFGGGAFLGAFLLQILPETEDLLSRAMKDIDYPVAPLIVGGGFFFIMITEKVLHTLTRSHQEGRELNATGKANTAYENPAGPGTYINQTDPQNCVNEVNLQPSNVHLGHEGLFRVNGDSESHQSSSQPVSELPNEVGLRTTTHGQTQDHPQPQSHAHSHII